MLVSWDQCFEAILVPAQREDRYRILNFFRWHFHAGHPYAACKGPERPEHLQGPGK